MAPKRKNPGTTASAVRVSQRLQELKHGAPTLIPELWEQLPEHPLDMVLSYLPAHKVVNTVKGIPHWKGILEGSSRLSYELLPGHGRNLSSSYGFLVHFQKNNAFPALSAAEEFPALSALEHESGEWVQLPPIAAPKENSRSIIRIKSGSDGLVVVTRTWATKCGIDYGVWNPMLRAMRWLPVRAEGPECGNEGLAIILNIMVDEMTKSYKLLALCGYEVMVDLALGEALKGLIFKPCYSVYNSLSQEWSPLQHCFKRAESTSERTRAINLTDCKSVSSNRHVFMVSQLGDEDLDEVIHCYSADRDVWDFMLMSKVLLDLGLTFKYSNVLKRTQEQWTVAAMVVQSNKLYIVVMKKRFAQFYIAAVDLDGDRFGPDSVVECLTRVSPFEGRECRSRFVYRVVHWYGCEIRGRQYICGILDSLVRETILRIMVDVETKTWVPSLVGCGCATVDHKYRFVCKPCVSKGNKVPGGSVRKRSSHVPFKASWVPV